MLTPHPTPGRASLRAAAGVLALLLASACADDTATGPPALEPAPGAVAALACRADVRAGTVECAAPAPARPGGASAAILGGQGLNVQLRSTGAALDSTGIFHIDVTVENLTGQALGTADGVTPTPTGVRVFFASGPASATGTVEVVNAMGEAFFTAAGQKYFQYDGMLPPGETTPPREWRFSVPPGAQSFQFTVYVAAAVARETGWLGVEPFLPSLAVGASLQLAAQRYNVAGRAGTTEAVTWRSADSAVARVAADGTVTGVATGSARVYATDGVRTSSVLVRVYPAGADVTPPVPGEFAIAERRVVASGADSVTFSARLADAGAGVRWLQASLMSPSGNQGTYCIAWEPAAGTPADGRYTCRAPMRYRAEGGMWTVRFLWVLDTLRNQRTIGPAGLRDAGVPAQVYVHSPDADVEAPTITSVTFTPDSIVANGADSTTVELQVADAGTGVVSASVWFRRPSGYMDSCDAWEPSAGTRAAGTFRCRIGFQFDETSGDWTLVSAWADDVSGNAREMNRAALDSIGAPTLLHVSRPPADTTAPTIESFSFTPDTVGANGADSVTVTMRLADAGSGAFRAEVQFIGPSRQSVGCADYATYQPPRPGEDEFTCRLAIPAGAQTGQWSVWYVEMRDALGNYRFALGPALKARGFLIDLTVTAP